MNRSTDGRPDEDDFNFNVFVVIDTPVSQKLPFAIRDHEFCHAHWGDYYVMIEPQSQMGVIEGFCGTDGVVGSLSPSEMYFYVTQISNLRLTFISESTDKFPSVGYLIEAPWNLKGPQLQYYEPNRALRVWIPENFQKRPPLFTFGIVDLNSIRCLTNRYHTLGTWHRRLWSRCLTLVPDAALEPQQAPQLSDANRPFRRLPEGPATDIEELKAYEFFGTVSATHSEAMQFLNLSERKYLTLTLLHNFWNNQKFKYAHRAEEYKRLGLSPNAYDGTVRNDEADAGLHDQNARQARRFFKDLKAEALGYFAANASSFPQSDPPTLRWAGCYAERLLAPLLPSRFQASIASNNWAPFDRPR